MSEQKKKTGGRESGAAGKAGRTPRLHPLYELTSSRSREFLREPEAVFWVFIFPLLLALALGIAFRNRPPEKLRVAIASSGNSARVMKYLEPSLDLTPEIMSPSEAARALRTGKVDLVLGPGSAKAALPAFSFTYDPTRPNSRLARLAVDDALQKGLGRKDAAEIKDRALTESGARYIDFLVPGLIGLNLMGSGMWGIGFNLVDARRRNLLKLFTATPMKRSHYLLSFMLSRLVFLVLEVVILVGFAWLVFGVKVHGSLVSLALLLLIGAFTFAGLGLLTASRAKSVEAVSGWMNFVMLPMWLLSGSFFPYSRFPAFTHFFIRLLPLTALNDSLRAIINDGSPLAASWSEITVLALWGMLCFAAALKIFRWR